MSHISEIWNFVICDNAPIPHCKAVSQDGDCILETPGCTPDDQFHIERAVVCVNACRGMENPEETIKSLAEELLGLVACLRAGEMGDYSPLMDEIFDSEHALRKAGFLGMHEQATKEGARKLRSPNQKQ